MPNDGWTARPPAVASGEIGCAGAGEVYGVVDRAGDRYGW